MVKLNDVILQLTNQYLAGKNISLRGGDIVQVKRVISIDDWTEVVIELTNGHTVCERVDRIEVQEVA